MQTALLILSAETLAIPGIGFSFIYFNSIIYFIYLFLALRAPTDSEE